MSNKEKVSEKVQEAIFNQLLARPSNDQCADCGNRSPTWVSLDFGVFVCIRCSGVHRQIGPHITRVRSTRLDGWQKDNIEIMAATGNKLSNDFYEYKMPSGYRKPTANSTPEECRRFIDKKYIEKTFAPPGYKEPVKEFIAARERGEKPNFDFSANAPSKTATQEQRDEESRSYMRKKSMSLDKLPSDAKDNEVKLTEAQKKIHQPHHNHQHEDLLSADHDLLGGGVHTDPNDDFGNFKSAETHSASPVKKINFANFKKGQQTQETNQNQAQQQTNWAWDMGGNQNNNQAGNSNNNTNNAGNNNNNANNNTQQQQQNQTQNKVDVMKLYSQPTVHQNHFMQGMQNMQGVQGMGGMNQGMQGQMNTQAWNQFGNSNNGGWNNQVNQGFNNGGQMGNMQGQNYGYNQNQGNFGGFNQGGQNMGFNNGQMGYNNNNNMGFGQGNMGGYQNNNMQANTNNRFF